MRIILAALLLAGCQDETQLNRIENKVDKIPKGTLFLAPDGTIRRKAEAKTPAR